MKIVTFQGGLGNQLFQYVFYLWLDMRCDKDNIYGCYPKKGLRAHNGLEIEKVFEVKLPNSSLSTGLIVKPIKLINKIFKSRQYIPTGGRLDVNGILFEGFWQDKCLWKDADIILNFRWLLKLDVTNSFITTKIQANNSIGIHIRRGDYLLPKYRNIYGDIRNEEYYQEAIEYILECVDEPFFFVFSDDIDWAKSMINMPNATFVNNNKGKDSYMDISLMGLCHHSIVANSTFSWWAAQLNKYSDKIMIAPIRWFESLFRDPNIFTEGWIRI